LHGQLLKQKQDLKSWRFYQTNNQTIKKNE